MIGSGWPWPAVQGTVQRAVAGSDRLVRAPGRRRRGADGRGAPAPGAPGGGHDGRRPGHHAVRPDARRLRGADVWQLRQPAYPVVDGDRAVGIFPSSAWTRCRARSGAAHRVAEAWCGASSADAGRRRRARRRHGGAAAVAAAPGPGAGRGAPRGPPLAGRRGAGPRHRAGTAVQPR